MADGAEYAEKIKSHPFGGGFFIRVNLYKIEAGSWR
jgi:hypothetical protein